MRETLTTIALVLLAGTVAVGCGGASAEEVELEYTTGGDGKPVGPSRMARPLDPAGPRASYPEVATGLGAPTAPTSGEQTAPECLADFDDLRIDVTDVFDGAAIIVTGGRSHAVALQESARAMAAAQLGETESRLAAAPETLGSEPAEGLGKPDEVAMPEVRIEVVDLAEGARISYFAVDPDDVIEVRNAVRRVASDLESGACPTTTTP
jgi:hypothetical protein